ncbi:Ig-like domain-containing protein [uncultured Methanobrevibacter sp.]|uniref:Ig-like domain-containing protein n=1 Tax=uncultured Methanobrevibacter sp. TaxID=253161 RepID=UPI00260D6C15|nr:Ig-like domain-containing protein [uncultured Methanobrevibacter sp.]
MICLVMLSVGTTFAADDGADVIAADDEIAVDGGELAVEQDTQINAPESEVVTPDNFYNYFDKDGLLRTNVTSKELIFEGTFENYDFKDLDIDRTITLTGKNATFNGISLLITANNVTVSGFEINQVNSTDAILVGASDVTIANNTVNFVDSRAPEGVAICAINSDNLNLLNNVVFYGGNTDGTYKNNGIFITNSSNARIKGNKFEFQLVSAAVDWQEVPAGSGNWVGTPFSEGVVVDSSEGVIMDDNYIDIWYLGVAGWFDTIYAVDFRNSSNAVITNNNITVKGHSYTYGLIITDNNFTIENNTIKVESDNNYANGIDIEGPAVGVVYNNDIDVKGVQSAYAIYSGMNGKSVYTYYTYNVISAEAYNVFGFSLGDVYAKLTNNSINLVGNYTTGIAYNGTYLYAQGNVIGLVSSEKGNETVSESFGVETVGIKATNPNGYAFIEGNYIIGQGKGISLTGGTATVSENNITVNANKDADAYAIYAKDLGAQLYVFNNVIEYVGATEGAGINNAIYISNCERPMIYVNKIVLSLVSSYVPWFEIPAGSGNWVSFPISEGIVIDSCYYPVVMGNAINVTYNNVVGSYDTIYAISVKNSNLTTINLNDITAKGHTYIYGIQASGDNITIELNNITVESDNYYANGIDIEGPASATVYGNYIDVKGVQSAYAIYSGMNGQSVSSEYDSNAIFAEAYNVFGFSLGEIMTSISNNLIDLAGNYTTGIAFNGTVLTAQNNTIILNSSEKGDESVWESFGVESVAIKALNGNATIVDNSIIGQGKGILLTGNGALVQNNTIDITDMDGLDSYGIYAEELSSLNITGNDVKFTGHTEGLGINNALYVADVLGASITDNKFNMSLVSCYVPWAEIPAGSGNWVSSPVSEGIVVEDCEGAGFENNVVDVTYNNISGLYDTIYAVDFKNSDYAMISGNNITALGHTYIYGIIISGQNFNINNNTIQAVSDEYYANGIDIEGPASGVVDSNVLDVKGVQSAYAIYSGMNGQNVTAMYIDNVIFAEAYNVFGLSLGDVESEVLSNFITLSGNYTTGIAFRGSNLTVNNTLIVAAGSNIGDEYVWEAFGVETIGIKVQQGTSEITNNIVVSTGSYPIDVFNNNASVHDNMLKAARFIGDEGVRNAANAEVYNNTPEIGEKNATSIVITEVDGDCNITGVLKDAEGKAMADTKVQYSVDGKIVGVTTTDKDGVFKATGLTNGKIELVNLGDSFNANSTVKITLKDIASVRTATVVEGNNYTQNAVEYNAGERGGNFTVQLKDINGKPLANKLVLIGYNGKCLERSTDKNGYASVQINLAAENRLTFAVAFLGDDKYDASMSVYLITITKKPVTISAPNKSYKASAKTKSYTVTLSTVKGADGKTYFGAGKKVTLKVDGKTITAKTNDKGQATFKLSLTKKGSYKATVSYAGDNTYKSATKTATIKIN